MEDHGRAESAARSSLGSPRGLPAEQGERRHERVERTDGELPTREWAQAEAMAERERSARRARFPQDSSSEAARWASDASVVSAKLMMWMPRIGSEGRSAESKGWLVGRMARCGRGQASWENKARRTSGALAQDSQRCAHGDRIRRHVARDDGAGANYTAVADGHSAEDRDASPEPDIAADGGGTEYVGL